MSARPRISGRMTARVVTLLRRHGKDPGALRLPIPELENPDARIDVDTVDRLVEGAASMLGAAGLGLQIAGVLDEDTYGAAGRVMLGARTLREAFELAFKHQRIWGDTERFSVRADESALRLGFAHPGDSPLARAILAELALIEVMGSVKVFAGMETTARAVRFAHAPLGGEDDLRMIFGCDVIFAETRNELALPPHLATAPLRPPPELLRHTLEREAQKAEATLPAQVSMVDRARVSAADLPSLRELAARLKVSARTLQRKLEAERSSYFEVIDAIRREKVARLSAQGMSEKNVAFEVGFGDERALSRARARWKV